MKADRYLFDGSHPCALRKLPCDSKDDHVKKEDILAKTAENLEKMAALQDAFYADGREGLVIILQALDAAGKPSPVRKCVSRRRAMAGDRGGCPRTIFCSSSTSTSKRSSLSR